MIKCLFVVHLMNILIIQTTCAMYDINTNEWKYIENMNKERSGLSVQKWKEKNNNIICVGGYNDGYPLNVVEEYDFLKQKWIELPNTIDVHRSCGIYILNQIIYVFGSGYHSKRDNFGIFEKYDTREREKKWIKIDELSKLFNFTKNDCEKRYFGRVIYIK